MATYNKVKRELIMHRYLTIVATKSSMEQLKLYLKLENIRQKNCDAVPRHIHFKSESRRTSKRL